MRSKGALAGMLVGGLVLAGVGIAIIPGVRDQALLVLPALFGAILGLSLAGAGWAGLVSGADAVPDDPHRH